MVGRRWYATGRILVVALAVVVPAVDLWIDPVHPWWVNAVATAFYALPVLVWAASARGQLADPVTFVVIPALMAVAFAISTLQPGRARPPAWDNVVGFGAMAALLCLVLLVVDSGQAPRRPGRLPYRYGLALLTLSLALAGGTALTKHRALAELSPSPSSADIPKVPNGYRIIRILTECSSFCGGLIAISGPDEPASQLEKEMTQALLDNGWQVEDGYLPNKRPDFVKPVGGFLGWHELEASVEIGRSPVAFPDINDPQLIVLGISRWVPVVKP